MILKGGHCIKLSAVGPSTLANRTCNVEEGELMTSRYTGYTLEANGLIDDLSQFWAREDNGICIDGNQAEQDCSLEKEFACGVRSKNFTLHVDSH